MENKKIYIGFEMKDEKAVQDFNEYQKKLAADPDFAKVVQEAKSEDQVYEYMKEKGYTDMSFQQFMNSLNELCDKMEAASDEALNSDGKRELSAEELDAVAGGHIFQKSWWKKNWKSVVQAIPVVGGITRTMIEIATGETKGGFAALRLAVSVGCMFLEEVPGIGYVGSQMIERVTNNVGMTAAEHGHIEAPIFEDNIGGKTFMV